MEAIDMPPEAAEELRILLARHPNTAPKLLEELEEGQVSGRLCAYCAYGWAYYAETGKLILYGDDWKMSKHFQIPMTPTPLELFVGKIHYRKPEDSPHAAALAQEIRAWQAAQPSA